MTVVRATLVTPLSGPLAGYGEAGAAALQLWAERGMHDAAIELTVFDAHPDPAAAMQRAEHTKPDLLFGPYGSSTTAAAARATSRLVWNHGGARVGASENVINVLAPADSYFVGALDVVQRADPGLGQVCVLHGDTGFGRDVADGAVDAAAGYGLHATRAALPDDPPEGELLLVVGGFDDELAAGRRLLPGRWRAAGFVGAGVDEVLAELGDRREGLLGPAQWLPDAAPIPQEGPAAPDFVTAYRERTGSEPPYPAAQAFAAGVIAARCLYDAGTPHDSALRSAVHQLACTTMFGRFRLDPSTGRQVGHQVLTVQWQDGVRRVVWPHEQAQTTLRYPLPYVRF